MCCPIAGDGFGAGADMLAQTGTRVFSVAFGLLMVAAAAVGSDGLPLVMAAACATVAPAASEAAVTSTVTNFM